MAKRNVSENSPNMSLLNVTRMRSRGFSLVPSTLGLAEVELGPERGLVWHELPVAVDLPGVLNADIELVLVVDENVSDVHLGDTQLCLRAAALPSHIQGEALLAAGDVAEGGAGVVVGTLGSEGDAAGDLCVGPDLPLQWLYREDLVLEEHRVFIHRLTDRLILA